jgi:hypothetical protein
MGDSQHQIAMLPHQIMAKAVMRFFSHQFETTLNINMSRGVRYSSSRARSK